MNSHENNSPICIDSPTYGTKIVYYVWNYNKMWICKISDNLTNYKLLKICSVCAIYLLKCIIHIAFLGYKSICLIKLWLNYYWLENSFEPNYFRYIFFEIIHFIHFSWHFKFDLFYYQIIIMQFNNYIEWIFGYF